MEMRESSQAIDERAADWAVRMGSGGLSVTERAELQTWLDGDSRRLGAFAKARAILSHTRRAKGLGPDFLVREQDEDERADDERPGRYAIAASRRRFIMWGGAAAASLIGGVAVWRHLPPAGDDYTTAKGEIRLVTLADGSSITLNTDTSVRVAFDAARRLVTLVRGEALFSVVAGLDTPFVVEVDGTRFVASASRFFVSKLDRQPVELLVRNGAIRLQGAAIRAEPVVVAANMRAVAAPGAPLAISPLAMEEVARRTSWVEGMLFFDDTPLTAALAEFARYTDTAIVLDDPSLGARTISGTFAASDPAGFTRAVSKVLDLRLRRENGALHLSR